MKVTSFSLLLILLLSPVALPGETIAGRFAPPTGFVRVRLDPGTFAAYLRDLPLKPPDVPVKLFNGEIKNRRVHAAVIDFDIGTRDLQQCADAVIRLRAEYLFARCEFSRIRFHFTSGFLAEYDHWRQGWRIQVRAGQVEWRKSAPADPTYREFRRFLDVVFMYAGTISLKRELRPVPVADLQAGDVFIQSGSPGHAVIVVDAARRAETGEKVILLAQSYMPAQDIHLLLNRRNPSVSPWYLSGGDGRLETPEWSFAWSDLCRFREGDQ